MRGLERNRELKIFLLLKNRIISRNMSMNVQPAKNSDSESDKTISRTTSETGSGSTEEVHVDPAALPEGMLVGENGSPAFSSSLSACVDLFFGVVPSVSEEGLERLLERAWEESPTTCVKIIFHTGACHSGKGHGKEKAEGGPPGGKSDRVNFLRALLWLYRKDPATLVANMGAVARFGCLKTVLDVLVEVVHDREEVACDEGGVYRERFGEGAKVGDGAGVPVPWCLGRATRRFPLQMYEAMRSEGKGISKEASKKERLAKMASQGRGVAGDYGAARKEVEAEMHTRLRGLLYDGPAAKAEVQETKGGRRVAVSQVGAVQAERRAYLRLEAVLEEEATPELRKAEGPLLELYHSVAEVLAAGLKDEEAAVAGGLRGTKFGGLFAKWAPTPEGFHDNMTCVVDLVVEKLYPRSEHMHGAEGQPASWSVYMSKKRGEYKRLLSRLRGHAEVPEHYVGKAAFGEVKYERLASLARARFGTKVFRAQDEERYDAYVTKRAQEASKPKEKEEKEKGMAAASLLPHMFVSGAVRSGLSSDAEELLLWNGMLEGVREGGAEGLRDAVAMCDVSGSMSGDPLHAAVGLSMVVGEMAEGRWHRKVLTFSSRPALVDVVAPRFKEDGEGVVEVSVRAAVRAMEQLNWCMSTNLEAAVALLAKEAEGGPLPKTVFIFSDMEFDCATGRRSGTHHEAMKAALTRAGRDGAEVPKFVFWNLRSSRSVPTVATEEGVALVSGFSPAMMRAMLKGEVGKFTPVSVMMEALGHAEYGRLVVA